MLVLQEGWQEIGVQDTGYKQIVFCLVMVGFVIAGLALVVYLFEEGRV